MIRGAFDQRITVQRIPTVTDDYGGEVPDPNAEPITVEQAYARVRYGPAGEQRQAAQESGTQAATFEVTPTAALLAVTLKDQILFDSSSWDISEVAPLDRHTLRFTATRSR